MTEIISTPSSPSPDAALAAGTARPLRPSEIERAAALIDPVFLHSPQFECEPLSHALGTRLTLKVETLNPIRSFKGRGASFWAAEQAPAHDGRTLVCASAGNWGQALAWVCRSRQWPLVVFTSRHANPAKVARMRALGAEVRMDAEDFAQAKAAARQFAADRGARFVEDGAEPAIAEGAGTIALELLGAGTAFDHALIPLGDGALAAGMGCWLKAHAPAVQVVAVAAERADAVAASWRSGRLVRRERADTAADGIAICEPVPQALVQLKDTIDDAVLVSEAAIERAMQLVFEQAGLVLEPAGAVGIAALLEHPALREGRVAAVLTGSNVVPAAQAG